MSDLIFGKTWEEIQDMQQKKYRPKVATSSSLPMATEDDVNLLRKYGLAGLEEKQFYGVIDRLKNSGIVATVTDKDKQ